MLEQRTQDHLQIEPGGQTELVELEASTEPYPEPERGALSRERAFPEWADETRKLILRVTPRLRREDLPAIQEWEQNGEIVLGRTRGTKLRSHEEAQVEWEHRREQRAALFPIFPGEQKRTALPQLHDATAPIARTGRQAVPMRHEAHGKP